MQRNKIINSMSEHVYVFCHMTLWDEIAWTITRAKHDKIRL